METSISSPFVVSPISKPLLSRSKVAEHPKHAVHFICRERNNRLIKTHQFDTARIAAINDVSAVTDPAQAGITWQIVVGTLAGVTPFVVAGIEFSKRIVAQKRCGVCGGSGLVLRDNKYYFRCPSCGGFLPWQSWKRFFSG
ncbi:uncharacterized protein LOC132312241 [Cornus florida]|uniref:uncharacterized protein LOC132312241 n=1 Tax=Cornus florida TaxID=4283 RepID=UPI00289F7ACF|nr:uncharacterized protein LOC132312241 [Cornus florida]